MGLNIFALKNLMDERFNGSYTKLSKAIGVDAAHVYRVIAKNNTPGIKFFNGIIKWCTDNQLDYRKYIFLPKPLTTVNEMAKV
ncbi:hypothetical protein [Clostridium sp.]|uniref:hypothetical protein n=1 Tax=Clostridium sp. TaxID=1506 RepID=UPI00262FC7B6|nr:hypothetical protein [uncultured Clostridium sp.]